MTELEIAQTEMTELEKAQTILFMIIRNNIVMPKGIELGKNEEEINEMAYNTMLEVYKMIDFDQAFETFKQARQSYSKRKSKND